MAVGPNLGTGRSRSVPKLGKFVFKKKAYWMLLQARELRLEGARDSKLDG